MERTHSRPRSKSAFSFRSDRSTPSKHESLSKESTGAVSDDRRKSQLASATKANPNAAMNEAQPIAAALEAPTLQPLRSLQHTDAGGNPIKEPDLSNPTRPRWERPLDTIRSFEAAIDSEYRRRAVTMRAESSPDMMSGYGSRRSSYYGGYDQRASQVGGLYNGRGAPSARESWADASQHPTTPARPRFSQRFQSESAWNRYPTGNGVYPTQGYQQSRDTVITGASAGSQSEPWANSTNPSSENSSIDRTTPSARADFSDQYGHAIFGVGSQVQAPIPEDYGYGHGPGNGFGYKRSHVNRTASPGAPLQQRSGNAQIPPPVPAKSSNPSVIKLGSSTVQQPNQLPTGRTSDTLAHNKTEKRKSWFKRRFSKS